MTDKLMRLELIPAEVKQMTFDLGFTEQKFKSEATTALNIWNDPKNSYMRNATSKSFFNSLVNLCKVNLTLNPIKKEAYLVPRKNGDNIEVFLEPSYIGLQKLIIDEGLIKNIQTNIVYSGDLFEIDLGDMTKFKHIPHYVRGQAKGEIIGVYSVAYFIEGGQQFEFMTKEEIDAIKEKSESYKAFKNGKARSAIWIDYESEMFRKTVLRRIIKYLPRTNVVEKKNYLDESVHLDEIGYSATNEQISYIDSLLQTSGLSEDKKCEIENEYVTMTYRGARECIDYLKQNQLSVMESTNPSAKDIKNHVKKISQ